MEKTMGLATVIVVGAAVLFGLAGVLWTYVFAVPIGIGLWIVAKACRWM
jgi:hypothetical protein